MLRFYTFAAFFYFCVLKVSDAQVRIRGKVLDAQTRQPLAYTNIGLPGKPVGTLSDPDGTFTLVIPSLFLGDTLFFSALGYDRKRIPVSALSVVDPVLYLTPKTAVLPTVQVRAVKYPGKTFEIGNSHINTGWIENDSLQSGAAMALRMDVGELVGEPPYYVTKARLRVWKATSTPYQIRLRLYEVDSVTNLPGADLLRESIVMNSIVRQGWLEIDLSSYAIVLTRRHFFLAFEWITTSGDRQQIARQYRDYKAQHPDRRRIDSVLVDGRKVAQEIWNYQGFQVGTAFGVSYNNAYTARQFACYTRKRSFDHWQRTTGILTAQITLNDRPVGSTQKQNLRQGRLSNTTPLEPCLEQDAACQTLRFLEEFRREKAIPGMQIAVSVQGKTVLSRGLGQADVARNLPVSVTTQFRVGSVSKALTSAALIKLVADHRLNLDAPVQEYVPAFPLKPYPVTTRHLAGHLAGIRHYRLNDPTDFIHNRHYSTARQALSLFERDSLLFEPGTRYHYSSYGWNLVGAVIEGASGQDFLPYMQQQIWLPLGMRYTFGDIADSLMPNRSQFYGAFGEPAPQEDLSYKYPGGGLVSTAEDLVNYGNSLLAQIDAGDSLTRLLFTSQTTRDGRPTGYGLGWNLTVDPNGHRIYWHDGDLAGSSAYLLIYPDDGIVISILSNAPQGILLDAKALGVRFYQQ